MIMDYIDKLVNSHMKDIAKKKEQYYIYQKRVVENPAAKAFLEALKEKGFNSMRGAEANTAAYTRESDWTTQQVTLNTYEWDDPNKYPKNVRLTTHTFGIGDYRARLEKEYRIVTIAELWDLVHNFEKILKKMSIHTNYEHEWLKLMDDGKAANEYEYSEINEDIKLDESKA